EAGRRVPPPPAGAKGKRNDLSGLLARFRASRIEEWSEDDWEAFTLQVLWRGWCAGGPRGRGPPPPPPPPPPPRDPVPPPVARADADLLVHDVLIRFCGAFLDQGLAHWQLPRRDEGFYRAFFALYRQPLGPPDRWLRELASDLGRLEVEHVSPLDCIRDSLD